jgi:signal transduction histidine kinase
LQRIFEQRYQQFWLLHTFGWLGFAIVSYFGTFFQDMRDTYVLVVVLDAYAGWLLTIPLRYAYQRMWDWTPWVLALAILMLSLAVACSWTAVKNFNYWQLYKHGFQPDEWYQYLRQTSVSFYVILSWSGLYLGVRYYQTLQQEKQKTLTASNKAHEAQLKMLRYQLNPHFLFNTLNAISTLVLLQETETANKMLLRLSDFLRYSLYKDPIKKVPLSQEIHAASLYLEIEKVRFSERLTIEYDIADNTEDALVPSLILQPLVENAIKFAVAKRLEGGLIAIKSRKFGHDLLIEVSDNGPGLQATQAQAKVVNPDSGVGLANTRERLAALYDKEFSLVLTENTPSGVKVNIRIPFEVELADEKHT